MNRKIYMAFLLVAAALMGFSSCSENDDETPEYANWQLKNTNFADSIYSVAQKEIAAGSTKWKIYKSWSRNDSLVAASSTNCIVVEVLDEGTGSGCPLYTDSVIVHNFGRLLPSKSYPNGYVIEKSYEGTADNYNPQTAQARKWLVSGLIDGYTTALQYMHIGDRWRIYIPYTLAYGTEDYNSIPGYSDLIFDVALLGYYRAGTDVPDLHAKDHNDGLWITE